MRCLLAWLVVATLLPAEEWTPPKNKNAALVYWRAFSLMKDLPSDEANSAKIQKVLSGEGDWDEKALGPIVEENANAVEQMRRGASLPECTFGLDYEDGATMLLPHLAKVRVLGKLNALTALREVAAGDEAAGVEGLLLGVRYADQLWRDGTLISALVARSTLSTHLRILIHVLGEGMLAEAQLVRIDQGLRALPPYALDWGTAVASEKACFAVEWKKIIDAPSPLKVLDEGGMFHDTVPSLQDLAAGKAPPEVEKRFRDAWHMEPKDLANGDKVRDYFRKSQDEYGKAMDAIAAAMRLPYLESRPKMAEVREKAATLSGYAQMMIPALDKANETRAVTEAERAECLALVALARARAAGKALSLDGMDVPPDPFTGRPLEVAQTAEGVEVRSAGKDGEKSLVFRLRR